jgi:hypothetical protein
MSLGLLQTVTVPGASKLTRETIEEAEELLIGISIKS